MTSTKYSISAAHRITGKSRTTISKHIKEGRLSAEKDRDNKPLIDAAELIRVYGDACDFQQEEGGRVKSKLSKGRHSKDPEASSNDRNLQSLLDREIKERERERAQHLAQIENLQDSLATAQEGHNRATLLLENQSTGGGGWEQAIASLKTQIAEEQSARKNELDSIRQAAERREQKLKKALAAQRSKSFWQRLWN